jgi:hypothetical protein
MALTLLCRTDAALARLIRAVAATLEGDRSAPTTQISPAELPATGSFGRELLPC